MRPVTHVDPSTGKVSRVHAVRSLRCGKLSYSSRKIAKATAVRQSKETGETIEAYKCRAGCHSWHLGHPPVRRETA